jgi:NAD(P)H-hydrate epimerase
VRRKLKAGFWNGIVIDFSAIEDYLDEDDCILIGPGMPREEGLLPGEQSTSHIVNNLLRKFPHKKWVIDGGALQVVDIDLLNENMIITPHHKEWERLLSQDDKLDLNSLSSLSNKEMSVVVERFSKRHRNVTVLLKGEEDVVCRGEEVVLVRGGNAGMTKGGTGDVLAGLVAGLYCKNDAFFVASMASRTMKKAGDALFSSKGVYFNASDLVEMVPEVLAEASRE